MYATPIQKAEISSLLKSSTAKALYGLDEADEHYAVRQEFSNKVASLLCGINPENSEEIRLIEERVLSRIGHFDLYAILLILENRSPNLLPKLECARKIARTVALVSAETSCYSPKSMRAFVTNMKHRLDY